MYEFQSRWTRGMKSRWTDAPPLVVNSIFYTLFLKVVLTVLLSQNLKPQAKYCLWPIQILLDFEPHCLVQKAAHQFLDNGQQLLTIAWLDLKPKVLCFQLWSILQKKKSWWLQIELKREATSCCFCILGVSTVLLRRGPFIHNWSRQVSPSSVLQTICDNYNDLLALKKGILRQL